MKKEDNVTQIINRMSSPPKKKSREEIKQKFKNKPPNENLHNYHTIKWLRSRFNQTLYQKSVNTLLPNNGIPIEDPGKVKTREELANVFLSSYCQPHDKFKNFEIPPKYLYSTLVMNKINKLLDIFLEFDGDGSRKLEIGEMVNMFKTNNIPVSEKELVGLFFKDKKLKSNEEPYLDFFQFMCFALSKDCDQDFRSFMRNLKKKKNHYGHDFVDKESYKDEENLFLPMNFNLVLDYFNNKGKQRESEEKIKAAIDKMNILMNPIKKANLDETTEKKDDTYTQSDNPNDNENEDEDKKKEGKYDDIDTFKVFEEFRKLFQQKHASEASNNTNKIVKKFLMLNDTNQLEILSQYTSRSGMMTNTGRILSSHHISPLNTKTASDLSPSPDKIETRESNMPFSKFLREKIDSDDKAKIPLKYYEKLKSVQLAAEEIKNMNGKNKISSLNSINSNFKSTAEKSGFNFNNREKSRGRSSKRNHEIKIEKTILSSERNTTNFVPDFLGNLIKKKSNQSITSNIKSDRIMSKKPVMINNFSLPEIKTNNLTKNLDFVPSKIMKELNTRTDLNQLPSNFLQNLNNINTNAAFNNVNKNFK